VLFVCALQTAYADAEELPKGQPHPSVQRAALATLRAAYGAKRNDAHLRRYPIGVFDSGTGGLTVLEQILTMDSFDNDTHLFKVGGDGQPDFVEESFVFFADQANMPYGNYPAMGKEGVLDDLILRDAQFLFGRHYHTSALAEVTRDDKLPVKAIVIACNTATAYGKPDIERVIHEADMAIRVIGVIEAGAEGAVEEFTDGRPGTIGIVPTQGTALSGAYPLAIRLLAKDQGLKQRISVVQQGAVGLAGAIDGRSEFIFRNTRGNSPRKEYRGPSLSNPKARIDATILARYDFDFSDNAVLFEGSPAEPTRIQLNSVENYIAYHLVTLIEKIRNSTDADPVRAMVLGCTHFPFYAETFRAELRRLYDYEENGKHVYRPHMVPEVRLVNPAYFTARKLYRSLAGDEKLLGSGVSERQDTRGEFYISVPCRRCAGVELDEDGWFSYEYKYGRTPGQLTPDFHRVPLESKYLQPEVEQRLRAQVPETWKLIQEFRTGSTKLPHRYPASGR
jgi:glutamate racemase